MPHAVEAAYSTADTHLAARAQVRRSVQLPRATPSPLLAAVGRSRVCCSHCASTLCLCCCCRVLTVSSTTECWHTPVIVVARGGRLIPASGDGLWAGEVRRSSCRWSGSGAAGGQRCAAVLVAKLVQPFLSAFLSAACRLRCSPRSDLMWRRPALHSPLEACQPALCSVVWSGTTTCRTASSANFLSSTARMSGTSRSLLLLRAEGRMRKSQTAEQLGRPATLRNAG